jgi:hypothetical protein
MSDIQALSPQIAAELAAGLSTKEEICARYEIAPEQWDVLRANPIFRNMVREAMQRFTGDLNSASRTRLKASILYEDTLPDLYHMVKDNMIPATSRVEAAKILGKTAGLDAPEAKDNPMGGFLFQVNINYSDPDRPNEKLVISGVTAPKLEATTAD